MKAYEEGYCCELHIDSGGFIHICCLKESEDHTYGKGEQHQCSCGQSWFIRNGKLFEGDCSEMFED